MILSLRLCVAKAIRGEKGKTCTTKHGAKWLSNCINALSNAKCLIIDSAMQSLCLNDNKGKKTMNSYFLNTADGDII